MDRSAGTASPSRHIAFRDGEVQRIRSLQGEISGPDLAKQYGVSSNVIYRIWNRTTWAFVPECAKTETAQGEQK
jgi:hypothetical protein